MGPDTQRLHDAIVTLGNAALDIATALSSLDAGEAPTESKASAVLDPTLGEVEQWKNDCTREIARDYRSYGTQRIAATAAELYPSYVAWCKATGWGPRTVKSFAFRLGANPRLVAHGRGPGKVRVLSKKADGPAPEKMVSYSSGTPIVLESRRKKRISAANRAAKAGYDFEAWCRTMRKVRTEHWKMSTRTFALMIGVTTTAVQTWEQGMCFALGGTRKRIESLAKQVHGIEPASWGS